MAVVIDIELDLGRASRLMSTTSLSGELGLVSSSIKSTGDTRLVFAIGLGEETVRLAE